VTLLDQHVQLGGQIVVAQPSNHYGRMFSGEVTVARKLTASSALTGASNFQVAPTPRMSVTAREQI
jgi:hypothetical protein